MQTLIQQLEGIVESRRKKQIRINGRQTMVTIELAEMILIVHEELQPVNQAWFVKLEARQMINLAMRLHNMMEVKA